MSMSMMIEKRWPTSGQIAPAILFLTDLQRTHGRRSGMIGGAPADCVTASANGRGIAERSIAR